MGEVYRAKDARLDRAIAVKILPSHLTENSDARQRFDREARTLSSLNHPNICTLHDVGHRDRIDSLVMWSNLQSSSLFDIEHTKSRGRCNNFAFIMTSLENNRIHELCSLIAVEEDRERFLKLCEELNRILSAKNERLQKTVLEGETSD
jgi:serine/threonine protein kinase